MKTCVKVLKLLKASPGSPTFYHELERLWLKVAKLRRTDPDFERLYLEICKEHPSREFAQGNESLEKQFNSGLVQNLATTMGIDLNGMLELWKDSEHQPDAKAKTSAIRIGTSSTKQPMTMGVMVKCMLSHMMRHQIFPKADQEAIVMKCTYGLQFAMQALLGRFPTDDEVKDMREATAKENRSIRELVTRICDGDFKWIQMDV